MAHEKSPARAKNQLILAHILSPILESQCVSTDLTNVKIPLVVIIVKLGYLDRITPDTRRVLEESCTSPLGHGQEFS